MLRVVVMNAKGGCGKTTVATNLASFCACQGYGTALFDYDVQGSSSRWLKARPAQRPPVHGVAAWQPPAAGTTRAWQMRIPEHTRYVITDTPAGHAGLDIEDRVADSDVVLIPVLPSSIDIHSTADFIRDLLLEGKARARNKTLAIISNRTRIRTRALEKLDRFLNSLEIPVIGQIRDTQHYLNAAEQGLGVHELKESSARQDAHTWEQVLEWLQAQEERRGAGVTPASLALPVATGGPSH
ncbi:MAG TPA: ParA family protein [Gammaproteobacteria bacterium]|nr:ParA family protein [Gammaproteobacteria bacterium]